MFKDLVLKKNRNIHVEKVYIHEIRKDFNKKDCIKNKYMKFINTQGEQTISNTINLLDFFES